MATLLVDLSTLDPTTEIILRSGDVSVATAPQTLQTNYIGTDATYPDAIGVSVVLKVGADIDTLTTRNPFPHRKVSYTSISHILAELVSTGYGMALYITPDLPRYPDHHSLAVTLANIVQPTLADDAAAALVRAFKQNIIQNPHQHP